MASYSFQKLLKERLPTFLKQYNIPLYQHQAIQSVARCRTAALGGHVQQCEQGHINGIWYNSCKCRACPQCRSMPAEEWLRNTESTLINCSHHHIVFTLPHELLDLWRYNRSQLSDFLFRATAETLKAFAKDTQFLGAVPGILLAQHTWGRDLSLHPHIHALVSHGGLGRDGQWVEPRKKHLFPCRPITEVFRGKFLSYCRKSLKASELTMPEGRDSVHILALLNRLGRQYWHVFFCDRYDTAEGVLKYLARYVKGGPVNKGQVRVAQNKDVIFSYTSHKTGRRENLRLALEAFLLRWLQHVPLPGKPLVRYVGLYSASCRAQLNVARRAHGQHAVTKRQVLLWQNYMAERDDCPVCSECGGALHYGMSVKRQRVA